MNSSSLQISIEVDDKGSVKIRQLGKTAQDTGEKGKKSFKGWRQQINKLKGDTDLSVSSFKTMAGVTFAGIVTGLGAITFGMGKAINAASDLAETQSKFETVFTGMTTQANAWAEDLRQNYAMSEREAKGFLSATQDMLVPMGMMPQAAGEMSHGIAQLSADLGSFNNLPTEQVIGDIQSALVGSYEPMLKYGAVLTADTVAQKAMTMGLAKTKEELTAAHKAQAAYQMIVEASSAAVGDMARTSEGYANQVKKLHSNVGDLTAAMGEYLMPIAADVIKQINAGFGDSKGSIDDLAATISVKLLQALGSAIEIMRFFHNGWLGIKLAGTLAIDGIAQSLNVFFKGIRFLGKGLDVIAQRLVKLGVIKVNPFDQIEAALGTFATSSRNVTKQVIADIESTNAKYDSIKSTIDGYVDQVKTAASEQQKMGNTAADAAGKVGNLGTAAQKTGQRIVTAAAARTKEQLALEVDLTKKIDTLTLSRFELERKELARSVKAMKQKAAGDEGLLDDVAKYHKLTLAKIDADERKSREESLAANRDKLQQLLGLQDDLTAAHGDHLASRQEAARAALEKEMRQIEEAKNAYLQSLRNKGVSDEKYAAERQRLDTEIADYQQKKLKEIEEGTRATTISMSQFFGEMAGTVQKTAGQELGKALIDEFGGIESGWGRVWDAMLAKMGEVVANMAVTWAASEVSNFFGWELPKFHTGLWTLEDEEVPAIIKKREMVLPEGPAEVVRQNLGSNNPGQNFEEIAARVKAWNQISSYNDPLGQRLGQAFLKQSPAVLSAVVAGQGVSTAIGQLVSPNAVMGLIQDAAIDIGYSHVGVVKSNWSKAGEILVGIATAMGLGGTPIAAGVGRFAGGWLGDRLGDALDDRDYENLRDRLEEAGVSYDVYKDAIDTARNRLEWTKEITNQLPYIFGLKDVPQGIVEVRETVESRIFDRALRQQAALDKVGAANKIEGSGHNWSERRDNNMREGHVTIGPAEITGIGFGFSDSDRPSDRPSHSSSGDNSYDDAHDRPSRHDTDVSDKDSSFAAGGIVSAVKIPQGEDGFGFLRLGEGVLDRDTMKILSDDIRSGRYGGGNNSEIVSALRELRHDINQLFNALYQIAKNTGNSADTLEKIDAVWLKVAQCR